MARVQRTLVIVEYVEVLIIVVTAVAAVAVLLAFDLFAERRGAEYRRAIAAGDP
jgi:hypothetical protein